ncbi:MAG: aldo/keto reductase [Oscillospiraceae bacterium]|nr:aldo/keto reductase [Oscillospiraceae bacterium]
MIYRKFQDKELSMLGFGTMRLPLNEDGSINEQLTEEMMDYALSHGINYIDTAWPYMANKSELVVGKILEKYPRDSFYLATKYPGHMIAEKYDPADVFERQLKKCRVDYFDFYLLHNVYENSLSVYEDPRWGIIDYFIEQKRLGRIKHLGFSTHADLPTMKRFIERYRDDLEFCQIQFNYLDWTLQNCREKLAFLKEKNIPVWVMEPVRGGQLVNLPEAEKAKLTALDSERSIASFGFRWMQQFDNIAVVLSGMSDMEQMIDNVATFDHYDPLSADEEAVVLDIAEHLKNSVPCTACRYCCDGCPMQLDIPYLISKLNQIRAGGGSTAAMQLDALPEDKLPSACIGCGACAAVCPQKLPIPDLMTEMNEELAKIPKWADICKQRAAAEKAAAAAENA